MRTKTIIALAMLATLSACGSQSGGPPNPPPSVAGRYERTNTNCEEAFDENVTVTQEGEAIIMTSDSGDFLDASGDIDANGFFTLDNANALCDGQWIDGVATANCDVLGAECSVTYERL